MRFMMIVKANADTEASKMPSMELLEAMGKFNEEMVKAGVMLAGEGLQASSKGAKVIFKPGQKPAAVDGPFSETKELIAGFWMIQVKSKEEAIQWATRCPASKNEIIEVRQIQEMTDFPAEVQKAAEGFTEMQTRNA